MNIFNDITIFNFVGCTYYYITAHQSAVNILLYQQKIVLNIKPGTYFSSGTVQIQSVQSTNAFKFLKKCLKLLVTELDIRTIKGISKI